MGNNWDKLFKPRLSIRRIDKSLNPNAPGNSAPDLPQRASNRGVWDRAWWPVLQPWTRATPRRREHARPRRKEHCWTMAKPRRKSRRKDPRLRWLQPISVIIAWRQLRCIVGPISLGHRVELVSFVYV